MSSDLDNFIHSPQEVLSSQCVTPAAGNNSGLQSLCYPSENEKFHVKDAHSNFSRLSRQQK
jgi:hypothetical protein